MLGLRKNGANLLVQHSGKALVVILYVDLYCGERRTFRGQSEAGRLCTQINITNRKTLQIGLQGPWKDMYELPIFTPLACIIQCLYVAFIFVVP